MTSNSETEILPYDLRGESQLSNTAQISIYRRAMDRVITICRKKNLLKRCTNSRGNIAVFADIPSGEKLKIQQIYYSPRYSLIFMYVSRMQPWPSSSMTSKWLHFENNKPTRAIFYMFLEAADSVIENTHTYKNPNEFFPIFCPTH